MMFRRVRQDQELADRTADTGPGVGHRSGPDITPLSGRSRSGRSVFSPMREMKQQRRRVAGVFGAVLAQRMFGGGMLHEGNLLDESHGAAPRTPRGGRRRMYTDRTINDRRHGSELLGQLTTIGLVAAGML